jgi:hypothetical protein
LTPAFGILKVDGDEETAVYHSGVRKGKGDFEPFKISMQDLTDGITEQEVRIVLYDMSKGGKGKVHGTFTTTFSRLGRLVGATIPLENAKKKRAGKFEIAKWSIQREPTLCDYFKSSLQIDVHVAIDFTSSNMDPLSPSSLHYHHDDRFNPYEACLSAFGQLLTKYSEKGRFAVYGFGGKVRGISETFFPLTFDSRDPTVVGHEGIMAIYRRSLAKIQLSHPTIFSKIIQLIRGPQHQRFMSARIYGVILILVDDVMSDPAETINEIVESSYQGVSIIIIGLGPRDFTSMESLNDFKEVKNQEGKPMKRKSVVFVWWEKYLSQAGEAGIKQVVRWTLIDLPNQIGEFSKLSEFAPDMAGD